MIQFFLIAFLILAVIGAGAILIAALQSKRAKKAETRLEALRADFGQVKEKAGRLQKALGETAKAGEEANAERNDLARTPDTDLVDRANNLFMRNDKTDKPGSAGNAGGAPAAPAGSAGNGSGDV